MNNDTNLIVEAVKVISNVVSTFTVAVFKMFRIRKSFRSLFHAITQNWITWNPFMPVFLPL